MVSTEVTIALEFWAGWIDSRNHGWQFYEPIAEHDWPDLARRIATHLEEGSAITEAAVLQRFDRRLRQDTPTGRTAGHYLLLLMAVVFAVEFIVFLVAALTNAGRNPDQALRFLVLGLAVFLTFAASLAMFARRTAYPGLCFMGLFLLQAGANSVSTLVATGTSEQLLRDAIATVLGIAALVVVAKANARVDGA